MASGEQSFLDFLGDAFVSTFNFLKRPSIVELFDLSLDKKYFQSLSSSTSLTDILLGFLILQQIPSPKRQFNTPLNITSSSPYFKFGSVEVFFSAMRHSQAVFLWLLYEEYASLEQQKYYEENKEDVSILIASQYTQIHPDDIIYIQYSSKTFCPAHYIAIDHSIQSIVIACRGTSTITDCLADCTLYYQSILCEGEYGLVHKGMFQTASTLYITDYPIVVDLLKKYPSYKLLCTGHSLGGAVASLLTLLFRCRNKDIQSYCVTFGAVPAVSENIATMELFKDCVISVINENDVIPRSSHKAVQELLERIDNVISMGGGELYYELQDSFGQNMNKKIEELIENNKITWEAIENTNYVGQALLPMGSCLKIHPFHQFKLKKTMLTNHGSSGYEIQVIEKYNTIVGTKILIDRISEYKQLLTKFDI
ncbi:sn-1-specific diacylglycerol lipase [Entamoeba marina]